MALSFNSYSLSLCISIFSCINYYTFKNESKTKLYIIGGKLGGIDVPAYMPGLRQLSRSLSVSIAKASLDRLY